MVVTLVERVFDAVGHVGLGVRPRPDRRRSGGELARPSDGAWIWAGASRGTAPAPPTSGTMRGRVRRGQRRLQDADDLERARPRISMVSPTRDARTRAPGPSPGRRRALPRPRRSAGGPGPGSAVKLSWPSSAPATAPMIVFGIAEGCHRPPGREAAAPAGRPQPRRPARQIWSATSTFMGAMPMPTPMLDASVTMTLPAK